MIYRLVLQPEAEKDLDAHIRAGNKILLKKIYQLFEELKEHPRTGTGKPEYLKYNLKGIWSRRINDEHRMLYVIDSDEVKVFVISLWGHYGDK
jgi:toxin YoeB